MDSLTEEELVQIAEVGGGKILDLTIAATLFGVLITLVIWLTTVGTRSPVQTAVAVAALIAIIPSLLFFGIRAYKNYRRSRELIERFIARG